MKFRWWITSGRPAVAALVVLTAGLTLPSGNVLAALGDITEYLLPTANSGPYFIEAGPDGNLWFTEQNANKVAKVTTSGSLTEYPVPTASSGPFGIAKGPDGNLWFTEQNANKVAKVTTSGVVTEYPIPTSSSGPFGIAAGPDGNLWFAEYIGKVAKVTTSGAFTEYSIPTVNTRAYGITAGPDGNIWFTEGGAKVGKVTPSGAFTEYTTPTANSNPFGIKAGPDGNLWFTEFQGNQVAKVTTSGLFTEYPIPTPSSYPEGIVAGPDGSFWFTEYGGNKVAKLDAHSGLRVTSNAAVPSQILVDGQIADSWGLDWLQEAPGNHTVCFTHTEGWTEPPCQTVTVSPSTATTVTGTFIQRGELRVITSPAVNSQISVDGNPTNEFGMWTDIPTGSHTVCFGAVVGFNPPACQTATVTAGTQTTITGTFTTNPSAVGQSGVGLLHAATSPPVPAQITIKPSAGNPYIADTWGLNWLELSPGSYTVTFSHVTGYTEPSPQTVTVTAGVASTVTGTFIQRGVLRVSTAPTPAKGTISVDGIPRDDWGTWTDIPTGSHIVCFGAAPGYANTPACQPATINPGASTTVTGTYS
jgi:streptogramin lyase